MDSCVTCRGDRLLSSSSPDDGTVEVGEADGSIYQFATSVASSPISLRMDLVGFLSQYKHMYDLACNFIISREYAHGLASSTGHSQILSRSRGEKLAAR